MKLVEAFAKFHDSLAMHFVFSQPF